MSSSNTTTPGFPKSGRTHNRRDSTPTSPRSGSGALHIDTSRSGAGGRSNQLSPKTSPVDGVRPTLAGGPEPRHIAPRTIASQTSNYSTAAIIHSIEKQLSLPTDQLDALVRQELDTPPSSAVARHAGNVVHFTPATGLTSAVTTGAPTEGEDAAATRGTDRRRRKSSVSTIATLAPSSSDHMTLIDFPRTRSTGGCRGESEIPPPLPAHARLLNGLHSKPDINEKYSAGKITWGDLSVTGTKEHLPDLEAQARTADMCIVNNRHTAHCRRSRRISPAICCMQYIVPPFVLGIFALIIFAIVKYR